MCWVFFFKWKWTAHILMLLHLPMLRFRTVVNLICLSRRGNHDYLIFLLHLYVDQNDSTIYFSCWCRWRSCSANNQRLYGSMSQQGTHTGDMFSFPLRLSPTSVCHRGYYVNVNSSVIVFISSVPLQTCGYQNQPSLHHSIQFLCDKVLKFS